MVTKEMVETWLGTSNPQAEAVDTLTEIANGRYAPELFKKEVEEACNGVS